MDFHSLPRRDLQTLCKRNNIPANMTNVAMAGALRALPMVEGLEAISREYQSPKRAAAGGSPEPPSRSSRRASTRRQPNPPGSSLSRTRQGAAGRANSTNEAAVKKKMEEGEEEGSEVVAEVGIPNSPTTLNTRGRRTRTLITTCGLEGEEGEEEEEAKIEKKGEAVPKTPATRATRGRRATTQFPKPSMGAEEAAKKEEEGGPQAVPQTPAASTARRASTRRATRAAPPPEEASGARSTRYRTRRAAMEEATELETAARAGTATSASRKKGMRREKDEDAGVLAEGVLVVGDDVAVGGAVAESAPEEGVELLDTEGLSSVDPTAEDSLEHKGSDGVQVDQTVKVVPAGAVVGEGEGSDGADLTAGEEKFSESKSVDQTVQKVPPAGVVEEGEGSDGVDQTVGEEKFGETESVDPRGEEEGFPTIDSIYRTVEESVDHTVAVEEAPVVASAVPTVENASSGHPLDLQGVADGPLVESADVEEASVVECDDPTVEQSYEDPGMGALVEVHQTVEDAPSGEPSDLQMMPLAVEMAPPEEFVDQTAVEEEVPKIVAEASLDQTVKEASDPVDFPSEAPLAWVEVKGHVDPTAQEMEAPEDIVDQTAVVEEVPKTVAEASLDQTVKEASDPVDFPSEAPLAWVEVKGHVDPTAQEMEAPEDIVDQTAVVEEVPKIVAEASLDQTVPVDFPSEEMLVWVEVEGHVDPMAQEMEVPILDSDVESTDPTVEDDGISASEGDAWEEETPTVGLGLEVFPFVGGSPEMKNPDAGTPAILQDSEVATSETLLPPIDVQVYQPAKGGEEEEEEVPGGERTAEIQKAVELEQTQKPLVAVRGEHGDLFCLGDQGKENAAIVKACMSPLRGGGGGAQNQQLQQQQMGVVEYNSTTSMRKLKAAVKEKIQKLREVEDRRQKRAALASLDDNLQHHEPQAVLMLEEKMMM